MPQLGKMMVLMGLAIVLMGAIVWGLGRLGFRGMPGDIRYESGNVHLYFPVVTCVVLSILLTLGMWIWRWFSRG